MSVSRVKIPLVDNVGADSDVIVKPSVGKSWKHITIEHTYDDPANPGTQIALDRFSMTDVKVYVVTDTDTKLIREYKDMNELYEINGRYKRYQKASGETTMYFARPELADNMRDMFTLGVADIVAFRIHFHIQKLDNSGNAISAPTIKAYGAQGGPMSINHGMIEVVTPFVKGGYAVGDNEFDGITRKGQLACLHMFNNAITAVEIRRDNVAIVDLSQARLVEEDQRTDVARPRVPYAETTGVAVDWTLSGNPLDALYLRNKQAGIQVQEFRVKTTLGAGANSTIRYVAEYFQDFTDL